MINREEFELERDIIDWIMTKKDINGPISFERAIILLQCMKRQDKTFFESYYEIIIKNKES